MANDTPGQGLAAYGIGPKLRQLRLQKKMNLAELGRHTGLSAPMLSKIERGRLYPTLPTLLRIARVFGAGLDTFFVRDAERRRLAIVRRAERQRFPDVPDGRDVSYHFESLDFAAVERKLCAYLADFEPLSAAAARRHAHPGAEFVFVLEGSLGLITEDGEHRLEEGDAIYFDASAAHGYRRASATPCRAIVVTVP